MHGILVLLLTKKIPNSLLSLSDNSSDQESRRREKGENPLNLIKFHFQETVLYQLYFFQKK